MHILLEVYSGAPISANKTTPLYRETIEEFLQRDLIDEIHDGMAAREFEPTEKLKVLMYYILSAPDPVWSMPKTA